MAPAPILLLEESFNYDQFSEVYDAGTSFFINWCENASISNNASECIEAVNASFGKNLVSMDTWLQPRMAFKNPGNERFQLLSASPQILGPKKATTCFKTEEAAALTESRTELRTAAPSEVC